MKFIDKRTANKEPQEPKVDGYSTLVLDGFEKPIPTFNKILVKLDEQVEEQVIGSIIVAGTSMKSVNTGTVIAIGESLLVNGTKEPLSNHIKVGDRVIVTRVKKDPVEINGSEYGLYNIVDIKLIFKAKV